MQLQSGQLKPVRVNASAATDTKGLSPMQDIKQQPPVPTSTIQRNPSSINRSPSATAAAASSVQRSPAFALTLPETDRSTVLAAAPYEKSPIDAIARWLEAVAIRNAKIQASIADAERRRSTTFHDLRTVAVGALTAKQQKSQIQTRLTTKATESKIGRLVNQADAEDIKLSGLQTALTAQLISNDDIYKSVLRSTGGEPTTTDWLINGSNLIGRNKAAWLSVDRWRALTAAGPTTADNAIGRRLLEIQAAAQTETRRFRNEYLTIVLASRMTYNEIENQAVSNIQDQFRTFSNYLQIDVLSDKPVTYSYESWTDFLDTIDAKLPADRNRDSDASVSSTPNRTDTLIRYLLDEDLRIAILRWTRRLDDLVTEYRTIQTELLATAKFVLQPLTALLQNLQVSKLTTIVAGIDDDNLIVVGHDVVSNDRQPDSNFAAMTLSERTLQGRLPLVALVIEQTGMTGRTTIYPPPLSVARFIQQPAGPALGQQLRKLPQENADPDWMAVFVGALSAERSFTVLRRPSTDTDAARLQIRLQRSDLNERIVVSITVDDDSTTDQKFAGWKRIQYWLQTMVSNQNSVAMIHTGTNWKAVKQMNYASRCFVRMPIGDTDAIVPLPHLARLRDAGQPIPSTSQSDTKTSAFARTQSVAAMTTNLFERKANIGQRTSSIAYSQNSSAIDVTGFTDLAVRAGFAGANGTALHRPYSVVTKNWSYWTAWSVAPLQVVPVWNPEASYKTNDQVKYAGLTYRIVDGYKSTVAPPDAKLPIVPPSTDDRFELFPLIVLCANEPLNDDDDELYNRNITLIVPRPFPSVPAMFNCVQVTIERTPLLRRQDKSKSETFIELTPPEETAVDTFSKIVIAASDARVGSKPSGLIGEVNYIAGEKGCSKLVVANGAPVGPILVNLAKLLASAFDVDFLTLTDAATTYCSYFNHPAGARYFFLRIANVFKEGIPWYGRFGFIPTGLDDSVEFIRKVLLPMPWTTVRDAMAQVIEDYADNGNNKITAPARRALEAVNNAGMSVCISNRTRGTNLTYDQAMQACSNDSKIQAGHVLIPASRIVCNSWTFLLNSIFAHVDPTAELLRILNRSSNDDSWLRRLSGYGDYISAANSIVELFSGEPRNLLIRRLSQEQYDNLV